MSSDNNNIIIIAILIANIYWALFKSITSFQQPLWYIPLLIRKLQIKKIGPNGKTCPKVHS